MSTTQVKTTANLAKAKTRPRRNSVSREKILEIATGMFADHGFTAISIRDIAGACSISIPSIYHFFGDKESLYMACCEHTFDEVAKQLHGSLSRGTGGARRIKFFTATLARVLSINHNFRRLLQRELLREEHRGIDELTTHHFSREFELLTHEITELTGDKDAMDRSFSIYALTFGLTQLRRIGQVTGTSKSIAGSSARLAEHVLSIVMPEISWTR